MSWGWKIALLYGGFVTLILTFVIPSPRRDVHLVTEDYYAQEIAYQERIDRTQAAQRLADPMSIRYEAAKGTITVDYPDGQRSLKGSVKLYRPSDARLDRTFEAQPDAEGLQVVSTQGMVPGLWRVQVLWEANGVRYYQAQVVVL